MGARRCSACSGGHRARAHQASVGGVGGFSQPRFEEGSTRCSIHLRAPFVRHVAFRRREQRRTARAVSAGAFFDSRKRRRRSEQPPAVRRPRNGPTGSRVRCRTVRTCGRRRRGTASCASPTARVRTDAAREEPHGRRASHHCGPSRRTRVTLQRCDQVRRRLDHRPRRHRPGARQPRLHLHEHLPEHPEVAPCRSA